MSPCAVVSVPSCDLPGDITETISGHLECKADQFHGGVYDVTVSQRCV